MVVLTFTECYSPRRSAYRNEANIPQYSCDAVTQMIPTLQMKQQQRHSLGNLPKIARLRSRCLVLFLIVTARKRECYWHLELRDDAEHPTPSA